jgi:hypothetical protein
MAATGGAVATQLITASADTKPQCPHRSTTTQAVIAASIDISKLFEDTDVPLEVVERLNHFCLRSSNLA